MKRTEADRVSPWYGRVKAVVQVTLATEPRGDRTAAYVTGRFG